MQEQVSKICREELTPALDKLFDRLVSTDEIVAIDKIEIDIGKIRPMNLEKELVEKIIHELEKQIPIQLLPDAKGTTKIPVQQNRFQMWLEFLANGTLPWQASKLNEDKWHRSVLSAIAKDEVLKERLKLFLRKNPLAIRRLVLQYEDSFLEKMIKATVGRIDLNMVKLYKELEVAIFSFSKKTKIKVEKKVMRNQFLQKKKLKRIFWEEMIKYYLTENQTKNEKEKVVQNILKRLVTPKGYPRFVNVLLRNVKESSSNAFLQLPLILQNLQKQSPSKFFPKKENQNLPKQKSKTDKDKILSNQKRKLKNKDLLKKEDEISSTEKNSFRKKTDNSDQEELLDINLFNEKDIKEDVEFDLKDIPEGTAYYVAHAGVIMTHPFLSRFFQKLNLLEDSKFKDETARQRAIHLLHFLASGETQIPEYELLLPKFLCGLPFEIPIEREVILTAEEKMECDNLLQAMIKNWGALGSTTPDGLREGFLQREGKLEKRQNGWYLQVEGKTIDMLLDKLPWNLSMIQLSWMKELLRVEWF